MGSHNAVKHKQLCFLGGPEDDLIRSKHVALTSIIFYGMYNKNVVLLIYCIYVIKLRYGKLKKKKKIIALMLLCCVLRFYSSHLLGNKPIYIVVL